jgi:hypothetical protein
MALVLNLKAGDDFYVKDRQFIIERVVSETNFTIREAATGKVFEITDTRSTEIMPDVMVAAGEPYVVSARVAIEAPADILILRGDKFRNPPANVRPRAPRR